MVLSKELLYWLWFCSCWIKLFLFFILCFKLLYTRSGDLNSSAIEFNWNWSTRTNDWVWLRLVIKHNQTHKSFPIKHNWMFNEVQFFRKRMQNCQPSTLEAWRWLLMVFTFLIVIVFNKIWLGLNLFDWVWIFLFVEPFKLHSGYIADLPSTAVSCLCVHCHICCCYLFIFNWK